MRDLIKVGCVALILTLSLAGQVAAGAYFGHRDQSDRSIVITRIGGS